MNQSKIKKNIFYFQEYLHQADEDYPRRVRKCLAPGTNGKIQVRILDLDILTYRLTDQVIVI